MAVAEPCDTLATRKVTWPDFGVVKCLPQNRTVAPWTAVPASATRKVTLAPPLLLRVADRASGASTSVAQ